mmetsp:Transcript_25484/g.64212  ORF Transcript_25484/g.64212 Transcript_25484/m.64212 type:complete len:487 (+) Transcript_25484:290-1750(+)|eukprot:CAMPEP_0179006206 /NCGR_PEP_ID=MMETSP0795-20121207/14408_1 /TAXON_ID=88552 /ORGANISM="Amoebophrya sp., Strain Ameob2" /LENGTH=486 /DNA_ID=CAMNT_0020700907 /DNA_START=288 /DNA_END=1748 /DNA_ORIENTATION=-
MTFSAYLRGRSNMRRVSDVLRRRAEVRNGALVSSATYPAASQRLLQTSKAASSSSRTSPYYSCPAQHQRRVRHFSTVIGEPFEWLPEEHWQDPLNLEESFTESEILIRDAARKFTENNLRPRVRDHFRKEEGDTRGIIKEMGDAGLLGVVLPEKYGCAGASATSYGLVAQEVEKCDSGYRSTLSVQSSLVMWPIHLFGQEALKDRLLPQLAAGDIVGAFGLSEPNHGSDPAGMTTHAKRDGDDWLLSGSKTWITNAPIADVFMVWAKVHDEGSKDHGKVRGFVIERADNPSSGTALQTPKIDGKFSLRASPTGMIMMDNARVPAGNVLDVVGMKGPFTCLNSARLGIAWGALGAAEDCVAIARRYLLDREMFKRPLAANQLVQKKLADAWTDIVLGRQLVARLTRMKEEGKLHSNMISMAKRNSCTKAIHIARECRDMLGGNGIVDEYGIITHVLNLEAVNTYEGTQDIHALVLGRAITGIPAFAN